MIKALRISVGIALALQSMLFLQSAYAAPATPSNVQVVIDTSSAYDNGTITVSWSALIGANGYTILVTREDDQTTERQSVTGAQNTSVQFTDLKGGKSYIVQVRSIVIDQASAWSSDTLKVVPKTAPRAPNKPTASVDVGKATVSWSAIPTSDSGGFDISSYVIREVTSGASVTAAATATSADLTGLTAGSTVEFTVTAINASNSTGTTSSKSDAVTVPSAPAQMSAPTMVASATDGEAGVTWVAPASNGGNATVSYTVKLLKGGVDLFSRVVTTLTNLSTTFTGLATGSYTAKVSATNGVGSSAFSLESSSLQVTRLIVQDPTPAPPTNNPPASGGGGVIAGGGGGTGTTWFNLQIVGPENINLPYPDEACAIFIHKLKDGDKQYGPICATKTGALDFEANDGDYLIRTFDKQTPQYYKEYRGKITFGSFDVVGAGYRGGSVPRRVITVLSKSEFPTPTPSATVGSETPKPVSSVAATPSASPKPSISPSPTSSSGTPQSLGFVVGGKISGLIKTTTLTSSKVSVALKSSANFQAVIPAVKKSDKVTMTIKDSKGKISLVPAIIVAKAGTVKLPSVKFSMPGKYTITVKVGTKTKVVSLTVSK